MYRYAVFRVLLFFLIYNWSSRLHVKNIVYIPNSMSGMPYLVLQDLGPGLVLMANILESYLVQFAEEGVILRAWNVG